MNNALLYISGFLVVVLAALFAVPHFIDWNSYRGVFEEEASRVLGRDVRIGGAVNLRLLPAPYVSLEKLKIADPGSSTGESLFRAESFTLWLSVPPLLKGVLEANKIEVRRPVVQLVASPEGGGNWNSLTINAGQMPLIPKGVSLQSVTITDGAMVIGTTARPEIARLEAINGDLSAEALNGPYKFSGTLMSEGAMRDVRIATSAIEDNDELRFKASVHALASGNTYAFSGKTADLKGRAKLEGDLTAELNVTLLSGSDAQNASPPKSEVTAKISGDATGVEFKEIAIALQQATTPQLVSGSAKVSWPQRTKVEVSLASRWLDFDKLAGAGKAVPVDVARQLFDGLASSLPTEADTSTKIILDQVTLGGDSVSDVRFEASRTGGGALELKDVRASLPGGARVEFDGQLTGADAARAFAGAIVLSGQSLQRFVAWGMGTDGLVSARADGPFALQGDLSLSHENISVRNASAEIAATPLSGEFTSSLSGRRVISLVVEGERIDAGAIWPGSLSADYASEILGAAVPSLGADSPAGASAQADAKAENTSPKTSVSTPKDMDVRVRLRAAELVDGERVLKNVDADFSVEGGALAMPRLNFTTASGLSVELEGETKAAASSKSADQSMKTGQVRGVISAPDAVALASLRQGLGFLPGAHAQSQSLSALTPLRLAGSVNFGARTARSADVQVDGIAGNARVTGSLLLDGGWSSWRVAPGDVTLTAESGNIARTLAALLGVDSKAAAQDFEPPRPGRLAIKAVAGTQGGFLSSVALRSEGLDATFDGASKFDGPEGWQSAGDLQIRSDDARSVLALAGLRSGKGAGQSPLAGTIKFSNAKDGQTFVFEGLHAGSSKVSGRVALAVSQEPSSKEPAISVDADLKVSSATVPAMFALLTSETSVASPRPSQLETEDKVLQSGKRRRLQTVAAAPVEPEPSVWGTQSFDLGLIAGLNGKIKATFGTLSLEPGLGVSDAILEAAITPGRVDIKKIDGRALGGTVTSSLSLDKDPVGMKLSGAFVLKAGGTSGADAVFKADASGRAPSLAGLIADLKGKGELALAEGALRVNSPAALTLVAEAALQGKGPAAGEDLAVAVREALKDSKQSLGGFTVPLTIGDGAMRFDKVQIDTAEGRSQFGGAIELDSLKLISEWQIEPKVQKVAGGERQLLAPVAVIYNGKLRDVATMEPEIAVAAMERELSVRKMERDVEELERLRKEDQARAAVELERRKGLEAERVKAIAAAKAAKEAAAAAGAAGLPVPPPNGGQSGELPQGRDNGASVMPVDPSGTALAAQGDSAVVPGSAGAVTPVEAGASNLGRPPAASARTPLRKKRTQDTPQWKPFQVTPY